MHLFQKTHNHLLKLALLLILLPAMIISPSVANTQSVTEDLQLVGEATLSKLFWTIYDGRLYNLTGEYEGIEPGLTLELTYQRKITVQQLVKSTRDEWESLGLYEQATSEPWLTDLLALWPNVKKNDVITLRVGDDLTSYFYFNEEFIGQIGNQQFTEHFLAIWLSPNTKYQKLQRELLGLNN